MTGKVANVILAGDDADDGDDGDDFLVEEKPKDNLDLLTENTAAAAVPQTEAVSVVLMIARHMIGYRSNSVAANIDSHISIITASFTFAYFFSNLLCPYNA